MTQKEFLYKILMEDNINTTIDCLKEINEVSFKTLSRHTEEYRQSYIDHYGFILFQMNALKCASILELSSGFRNNPALVKLVDPFSVYTLTRAIFESYCNFNNIYIQSKSISEKVLKYELWVLAGLKYRQRFPASITEHQEKKEAEKMQIQSIIESIRSNEIYISCDERSKEQIEACIKQYKWQLMIINGKVRIGGWQDLFKQISSNDHYDQFYTSLSLNTHPSNIAVAQFAEMYETDWATNSLKMALDLTKIFMCLFIEDYCTYYTPVSYKDISQKAEYLIELYNKMRT